MKNDEKIIAALLSCATIREAAEAAGVSERTIYNRLSCPEFSEKLAEERRRLFKAHSTALQGQIGRSIQAIVEIRDNAKNSPQVRLNASAELIRSGLKVVELVDVVERMDTIENRLEDMK